MSSSPGGEIARLNRKTLRTFKHKLRPRPGSKVPKKSSATTSVAKDKI